MAILRKHQRSTYTVIDNEAIRDAGLSFKATGLLVYLLSLPDDWNVNITDLTRRKTDGKTAVTSALDELKAAGYVVLVEARDGHGRFAQYLDVHESPLNGNDQDDVESDGFSDSGVSDFGESDFGDSAPKKEPLGRTEKEVPNKTLAKRETDPVWDTLTELLGQPTSTSLQGKIVKQLHTAGIEPEHLRRIMQRIAVAWGPEKVTLASVGKHFPRFADDNPLASVTSADRDEWERRQRREARRAAMTARIEATDG